MAVEAALLAATVELLLERGYARLSLKAIAERAGTSTPTIYRRWPSKAELVWDAVFGRSLFTLSLSGDLEADLRAIIASLLDVFGRPEGRAAFGGLISESRPGDGEDFPIVKSVLATLDRLTGAGGWTGLRTDVAPDIVIAAMVGPAFFRAIRPLPDDTDSVVDELVQVCLSAIR